jgi:hypothetical protein
LVAKENAHCESTVETVASMHSGATPITAASSARSAGVAGRLATSATGSGSRCAAAGEATAAVATTARRTTSERLIGPPALRSAGRLLVLVEPTLNAEGVESTSESVLYRD